MKKIEIEMQTLAQNTTQREEQSTIEEEEEEYMLTGNLRDMYKKKGLFDSPKSSMFTSATVTPPNEF